MHYKDQNNALYFLDDANFLHLLPADCVPITDAEAAALVPRPSISDLKTFAIKNVRAVRVQVFSTLAGIQSQSLANGDTTTAKAISGLQDLLKALPDIDLSNCKTEDDVNAAFAAAWMTIVTDAPANVIGAFNEVFA